MPLGAKKVVEKTIIIYNLRFHFVSVGELPVMSGGKTLK